MPASAAERVVEAGRACSLTGATLREWASRGTPRQVEYLAEFLEAERASREASRRAALLECHPLSFTGGNHAASGRSACASSNSMGLM